MKNLILILSVCFCLTGCSANRYVLDKIDAYDNNFEAIGNKIQQTDANFEIIQQHFVTKEILQKFKPECPACICNYTEKGVIRMEDKAKKEEGTQEETTQEEKTSEESTQSEESQTAEENATDEEKTEEESASTEEESKEEGSETESKEEEAPKEEASAPAPEPQGRVGV